jgi:hypothetical protein
VIDFVVAPVLHKYDVPEVEVNRTESPWQKVVNPDELIVAVAGALTVTDVAADVAEHPLPFVTLTV